MSGQEKSEHVEELETHMRLDPERLRQAEQVRTVYCVTVPAGTPKERIVDGRFWSKCIPNLRRLDRIECVDPGVTWWHQVMVLSVGAEEVEVVLVPGGGSLPDRRAPAQHRGPLGTNPDDFDIADLGPGEGHAVVLRHENKQLWRSQAVNSHAQCARWLQEEIKRRRHEQVRK